ncbi:pentapeptide repeat-containing protein [Aetokthonos hydrillicola]|uniref:pentapeptide repeat-containing protein n=1 Tax=Aetokthonos hydrillicola TaxID=1550245 RepID=UPI001ABB1543|nr:pentapeptide repeat-containing protein [Aetokthonos hydrillicola]MBO3463023.1 transcriptional regulator, XRE family protein [Aetokthonos hydrillicola CCALA 1050]
MGRSCRASKEGAEKIKKAFQLKGWTQDYLAGTVRCTRQTVIKFFASKPVEKRLFQAICNELDLEWGEIAELEIEQEQSSRNSVMNTAQKNTCEIASGDYSTTKVLTPPVSVAIEQKPSGKGKAIFVLTGTIDSVDEELLRALETHLRTISKDALLTIKKTEEGSIKITLEASLKGLERLVALFNSGELTEVLGIPVEDVQLLPSTTRDEDQDKSRLVQEIIAQGAKGRNLCDVDLSGANLSGADLSNADLSCADLSDTDLRKANLSGSDLNCADLSGTDLTDADLSGAYLHDAIIDSATRISDKWRLVWEIVNHGSEGRDLRGAMLWNNNLKGAILWNANLSGANLRNANLSDANLRNANLSGAYLSYANLSGANLSGATLWNANLSGAYLSYANLSGAYLSDAYLSYANLSGANLSGADLSSADLSRANLSGANLSDANLSRAYLHDVIIDSATRISDKWRLVWEIVNQGSEGRDLSGANLSGTNLSYANLRDANLSYANLSYANLSGAYLRDANLSGANLRDANLISAKVEKALFIETKGLTEDMKQNLKQRGAIFEDSPGDRSEVYAGR